MTSRAKIVVAVIAIAVMVVLALAVFWIPREFRHVVDDSYAKWGTAEMIIAFYEDHKRLPANWDDLRPAFVTGSAFPRGGLSFPKIQNLVVVNFDRLGELQRASNEKVLPPVIQARDGRTAHWSGAEPNEMVFEYFHQKPQPEPRRNPRV
jgi:hypothetical protein